MAVHISEIVGALPRVQYDAKSPAKPKPAPSSANATAARDCPVCKGSGFVARDVPVGHPDFDKKWPCPHPCHAAERLARLARLAKLSGLAEADLGLRLVDFKANGTVAGAVLAAAQSFLADPTPLLYLWGGYGNGKTLLLKSLVNEFNEQGRVAVYAKFSRLLWWMRQVFSDNGDREGYLGRYERLKRVPVLAVDEFDKANLTAFAQEFQFDFLDERYEAGLRGECCTVFASNSPPGELPGYLLSRVEDGRCLVIENRGKDLRPHLGG
jgi:DNA replication protein DnaC